MADSEEHAAKTAHVQEVKKTPSSFCCQHSMNVLRASRSLPEYSPKRRGFDGLELCTTESFYSPLVIEGGLSRQSEMLTSAEQSWVDGSFACSVTSPSELTFKEPYVMIISSVLRHSKRRQGTDLQDAEQVDLRSIALIHSEKLRE